MRAPDEQGTDSPEREQSFGVGRVLVAKDFLADLRWRGGRVGEAMTARGGRLLSDLQAGFE